MSDKMTITVLPDGTLKTVTDEISAPNHDDADAFIKAVARLCGGATTSKPREDVVHAHVHHHGEHSHSHAEGEHHKH